MARFRFSESGHHEILVFQPKVPERQADGVNGGWKRVGCVVMTTMHEGRHAGESRLLALSHVLAVGSVQSNEGDVVQVPRGVVVSRVNDHLLRQEVLCHVTRAIRLQKLVG